MCKKRERMEIFFSLPLSADLVLTSHVSFPNNFCKEKGWGGVVSDVLLAKKNISINRDGKKRTTTVLQK